MKLVWLPGSFEAGIAITDDPDNASFTQFKAVYDLLSELGLSTTRAMWVYEQQEPTGTPPLDISFSAPLLTDGACLDYCKHLSRNGFEICLHGASSGNNSRNKMAAALELLEREIAASRTYICHSKNAENLYWDSKCTDNPVFSFFLRQYTRNQCFGEIENSAYFWGDYCRQKIDYIRLFRTRSVNTLAFNPSMPYHDFSKPYVNFWFSATKGYLPRLFTPQSIDVLCREHGASILYQYLHRYADDSGNIRDDVRECFERLAGDRRIFFRPATELLDRLRQARLLYPVRFKGRSYIINASRNSFDSVQIKLESGDSVTTASPQQGWKFHPDRVIIEKLPPLSVSGLPIATLSDGRGFRKAYISGDLIFIRCGLATIVANCSDTAAAIQPACRKFVPTDATDQTVLPGEVKVFYSHPDAQRLEILQPISRLELDRLFLGQASILLREHLFLGRKISTGNYFRDPGKIEDPANW